MTKRQPSRGAVVRFLKLLTFASLCLIAYVFLHSMRDAETDFPPKKASITTSNSGQEAGKPPTLADAIGPLYLPGDTPGNSVQREEKEALEWVQRQFGPTPYLLKEYPSPTNQSWGAGKEPQNCPDYLYRCYRVGVVLLYRTGEDLRMGHAAWTVDLDNKSISSADSDNLVWFKPTSDAQNSVAAWFSSESSKATQAKSPLNNQDAISDSSTREQPTPNPSATPQQEVAPSSSPLN